MTISISLPLSRDGAETYRCEKPSVSAGVAEELEISTSVVRDAFCFVRLVLVFLVEHQ